MSFIFIFYIYLQITKVFLMIHKNNNSMFLLPSMSCILWHHPIHSAVYRRHNTWINVYLNVVFGEVRKSLIYFCCCYETNLRESVQPCNFRVWNKYHCLDKELWDSIYSHYLCFKKGYF